MARVIPWRIHHQPQVGLDHPLLGPLTAVQNLTPFACAQVGLCSLLQQSLAPLHQAGQGELLLLAQQVNPADVLEIQPHQVGDGGGVGQRQTPGFLQLCQCRQVISGFCPVSFGF